MKFIDLKSDRLVKYLQSITEIVFNKQNTEHISRARPLKDERILDIEDTCSEEYLRKAMSFDPELYGFPQSCLGFSMLQYEHNSFRIAEQVKKHTSRIENYLGTYVNALIMAYPDKGYIGWHHNGNAPGYNILFTYSQDGDGFFDYYDHDTKQVVRMQDKVGWSAKIGYYPSIRRKEEKNKLYWHCAKTVKQRITVAYVIPDRDIWINMVETITDNNFDPSILQQSHMPS